MLRTMTRRSAGGLAVALGAAVVLAGCTGTRSTAVAPGSASPTTPPSRSTAAPAGPLPASAAPTPPPVPALAVVTSFTDGVAGVRPDRPVGVTVGAGPVGRLTKVSLTSAAGAVVTGSTSANGQRWTSTGRLAPSTTYTLTATGTVTPGTRGVGSTSRRTFTTIRPTASLRASVAPLDGTTVGVGMPIIVVFSARVTDRAAVQRALHVTAGRPVAGSWNWIDSTTVHYRPTTYWPAHTSVRLQADLVGVDAGAGVWGTKDRDISFTIGRSVVDRVDLKRHVMGVYIDGRLARTLPITGGKDGFSTRSGTKVIMEKYRVKHMDAATTGIEPGSPNYYQVDAPFAMRVTNSGEFLHGAPWSTGSQGSANVSHGCVGMSLADAEWLFDQSKVGDVVQVTGSTRAIEPGNGWSDWNVSWTRWAAGSAL